VPIDRSILAVRGATEARAGAARENARVGQEAPLRVLLVDDDEVFLATATEVLSTDERVEVVGAARDGEEALACVERVRPDLVLMDITMPALDGVEATRAIRARLPDLPVVMLTAREGRAEEDASAEAGAIGYVRKDDLGSPHFADSLVALIKLSS
jgi:DNA-binding NarL/FixJ family response regulator